MFDFGMRIKTLRLKQNITQEVLGNKVGKSKSVICCYENNTKFPPLDVLTSLAVIFNVSLDYLVGIDKKEMVSLDGLTDKQKETIYALISEFKNIPTKNIGLTEKQQNILNQILVEFTKSK